MARVRVGREAQSAIDLLGPFVAERFRQVDLDPVVELLSVDGVAEALPHAGPGHWLPNIEAKTPNLDFFHVFISVDDQGGVFVYHIDIWPFAQSKFLDNK